MKHYKASHKIICIVKNIIFIVGVGRSGTSLLQSVLNAHSEVAFMPETQFFRKYIASKKTTPTDLAEFKKTLEADTSFHRTGIAPDDLLSDFKGDTFTAIEAYKLLLNTYLNKKNKKNIGDKDPRNIDYLPKLYEHFPDAKIIHIYRDPRDVVLSKTKAAWSAHRPFWMHAIIGQCQLARGRKIGKQLYGNNFFEIKYEELIKQPEQTIRNLSVYLNIEYQSDMMNFANSSRELVDEKEMSWKKETFQPIQKNNSGKWKENFTSKQIQYIEAVSNEAFDQLNYEKINDKSPLGMSFVARITNMLFPILYKFKM